MLNWYKHKYLLCLLGFLYFKGPDKDKMLVFQQSVEKPL